MSVDVDGADDDQVRLCFRSSNSNVSVYHSDPDCPVIKQKQTTPVQRDEAYLEWHDLDECSYCRGDHVGGGWSK